METRGHQVRKIASLGLLASTVILAYYFIRQIDGQNVLGVLLPAMGVLCIIVFLNPRLGLYAFCFTLILVPYDWRIEGLKFTSANVLVVGAASVALVTSMVVHRQRVTLSRIVIPFLIVVGVAGVNYFRYGPAFFYVPYVLVESLVLFILATQLIRKDDHLQRLTVALAGVIIVRSLLDLSVTLYSFHAGDALGDIRYDRLLIAGTVTTEAEWRSLLLPILAMSALFARNKGLQVLFLTAVFLDVAWLAFSASRTGLLGLGLAVVISPIVVPSAARKRAIRLAVPTIVVALVMMTVFSQAWGHIVAKSQKDIFTNSHEESRWILWGGSFSAFWESPWVGNSVGQKHSFILEDARSMGLVFLVPYGIAVYLVWRRLSKIRRLWPPQASLGFIYGLQAAILMVAVLGVTGSLLNTGVNAFFFWMLVGAAEGYYLQQHKEQQTEEASAVQGYLSRLRFRRRREASARGVLS
jgi:hypothetical protein